MQHLYFAGRMALVAAVLTILWMASPAYAQVTTASFFGTVHDPTGAAGAGATVILKQEGTGAVRRQEVSASGEFAFEFLTVGPYTLTIELKGFKRYEESGILLGAAQRLRRLFTLELGAATETVTVRGAAPLLNAVSSEQRESKSELEVKELPLGRRDISAIVALSSGIQTLGGNRTNYVMNGLGRSGANITMDGIDASAYTEGQSTRPTGAFSYIGVVSMEAVDEVQVTKGSYPAEYGLSLSGNINVITKSGTNIWHGTAFELFQAEELNARDPLLARKPGLTYNQFGASAGGRIVRDKIFVFGAYEGYSERAFRTVQGTVPTQLLQDRMVAANPSFKRLFDEKLPLFPLPNQPALPGTDGLAGVFLGAGSLKSSTKDFVIKPDVWLWSRGRLSMTYVSSVPDQILPRFSPLNSQFLRGNIDRYTFNFSTFGPKWSAESRFGWNRSDNFANDGIFLAKDTEKEESIFGGRRLNGLEIQSLGISQSGELNDKQGSPRWSIEQKVAYTVGRHSLKFGGIFFRQHSSRANVETPQIRFANVNDLLANRPAQAQFTFGQPPYKSDSFVVGSFFQDDWRLTSRLVVNLGLRYDYFATWFTHALNSDGPPHIFNAPLNLSNFTLGTPRPIDSPTDGDHVNVGPRFGFAYDLDGRGKTVVRGGFGLMFIPPSPGNFALNTIISPQSPYRTTFNTAEIQRLGIKYPSWNEDVLRLVQGGTANPSFQIIAPDLKASYAINYSLSVQRYLAPAWMFETAFVGNRGVKLLFDRRYNEPDRVTGIRPNPTISDNLFFDNSDGSYYVSWQNSLRKRYSRNLVANVHYTWSKAIGYGAGDIVETTGRSLIQDFFNIRANRGRSPQDVTHLFTLDLVYELPRLSGFRNPLRRVLGGWDVAGIWSASTGQPFTITQPTSRDRSRPDVIDFENAVLNDFPQYLNPRAFARVPVIAATNQPGRPGNVGRNVWSGPGQWNVDFSFGKTVPLKERVSLRVRADMFNTFNHINPTGLDTNISSPRFGRLTSTAGARRIQLQARLSF